MARRAASRPRAGLAWLVVFLGLLLYGGLVSALPWMPVRLDVPLPWWAVQAAPVALYALLVLLFVRGASAGGWLLGTLLLCMAHALLGMATVAAIGFLDPAVRARGLIVAFPPPPLPQLLWVPLLILPLRSMLGRPAPRAAPHVGIERRREPERRRTAAPAEPAPRLRPVAAPVAESPSVAAVHEAVAPRAAAPRADRPAPPPVEGSVRIPFARVAEQFPAGAFADTADRVAAALAEPGYLVVPLALVLPQLAEGLVRVAWNDLRAQLPGHLLAAKEEDIRRHLGPGLMLPLDEVVRQVPSDLFAQSGPAPDLSAIEDFPAPFRPEPAQAEPVAPAAPDEAASAPTVLEPEAEPDLGWAEPEPMAAELEPMSAEPEVVSAGAEPVTAEPALAAASAPAPAEPEALEPPPLETAPLRDWAQPEEAGSEADTIRISFARIARQLPPDAFLLPLERIGANMSTPDWLMVSREAVLPQLGEGVVGVSWYEVSPQFPRHLLAVTDEDLAARLPEGRLSLPLDEVIRQLPADLFAMTGPALDISGIEDFPSPFQPLELHSATEEEPIDSAARVPDEALFEVPAVEEAPVLDGAVVPHELSAEQSAEPALEVNAEPPALDFEPAVTPVGREAADRGWDEVPLEPSAAEHHVADVEPPRVEPDLPPVLEIPEIEPERTIMELLEAEVGAPAAGAPGALAVERREASGATGPAGPRVALSPEHMEAARRVAAGLASVAPLDVDVQVLDGVTLFTLAAPGAAREMAVGAARLLLPILGDGRLPWTPEQVTLRGRAGAVVVTPLAPVPSGGPVLVAAAPQRGSLALLEILCRRAAGQTRTNGAAPTPEPAPDADPARLEDLGGSPRLVQAAAALGAFGTVSPKALADADGSAALYLFLPPGTDVRAVGAFARDLGRAMGRAAASGAPWRTATLRAGRRCMVVRSEEGAGGRPQILVAAGDSARPGLAYRQVERAAQALGAA
ncbi:MAG TPA: hypothetical protein VFN71_14865 [Methylomirabilota bacterium]|nr:hypothetical protein [Methylomirabilota bacterium]